MTKPPKKPLPRRGGSYRREDGKLVPADTRPDTRQAPEETAPAPAKGRARKETDQ